MSSHQILRWQLFVVASLVGPLFTSTSDAQVSDVIVVGVTPTCPYGLSACAVGAREGLQKLKGVRVVAEHPDRYNCTFDVILDEGGLPDPTSWRKQFKTVVGEAFVFRGVEVQITGTIVELGERLVLTADGLEKPVTLARLENKLQWNFRKSRSRQPEPDERDAYSQLVSEQRKVSTTSDKFEITGPLRITEDESVIEVREFFISKDP